MNWFNQYRGYLVCALLGIVIGALGVLWLKSSKSQIMISNPVVDNPPPVLPDFHSLPDLPEDNHYTYGNPPKRLERLGGSIAKTSTEPATAQPETPRQQTSPQRPCEPFSLRLKSSPTSLSSVLDSVVVLYFYPSGAHNFEYYPRPQIPPGPQSHASFLSIGFATNYLRYQNNLEGFVYGRVRISGLNLESGFHHQTNRQLGWFVGVRREWRIF